METREDEEEGDPDHGENRDGKRLTMGSPWAPISRWRPRMCPGQDEDYPRDFGGAGVSEKMIGEQGTVGAGGGPGKPGCNAGRSGGPGL